MIFLFVNFKQNKLSVASVVVLMFLSDFCRKSTKTPIAKLKHYGICGPLLNWFISFQRVVIPGGVASWIEILACVPQGSIIGPLLFIIFINDLVKEIHSNIRLFADDTCLFI